MKMKKFAPVALWLLSATSAYAQGPDREVWISLGAETLGPVRAEFQEKGWEVPAPARETAGVAALRVRESQLARLSELMHEKFNRCAGFIQHDSREDALAAVEGASSFGAAQLVAASYTLDNASVVNALMGGLQEANVRSTITTLSGYTTRYYTSQSGVNAANWLKGQWETFAQGRSDISVELFTHAGWAQPSVILTIQGATQPSEVVVLGGHLDSFNSSGGNAPGADDDASGIASLTEALRVALAQGYYPAKTVKFMAYAAEEVGLRGSSEIATWHKNNGVNVVGVLQLDMTNYRGSSVDVGIVTDNTNAAQNTFLTNLIDTYVGATWANTQCGYGCSDHASWTSKGFPASIPFEALMGQHN
ncbi:MAG TPA: M20/M25/M40 family metallo-hydrolase, partial [Myxococcaceae bacterium]|nr:M20/M25/M40 family metallo-hydrolase [Myxococcaceae bacterium]